jgi:hypothetical protein
MAVFTLSSLAAGLAGSRSILIARRPSMASARPG